MKLEATHFFKLGILFDPYFQLLISFIIKSSNCFFCVIFMKKMTNICKHAAENCQNMCKGEEKVTTTTPSSTTAPTITG